MLATMRPMQLHPNTQVGHSRSMSRNSTNNGSATNSAAPSRPSSVKLSRSNSNRSNTSNGEKHNNVTSNVKAGKANSKRAPSSALVNEVQSTPGLIALSRPLGESSNRKGKAAELTADMTSKSSRNQRKKKASAFDDTGDMSQLSSSAPAAQGKTNPEWSMPGHRAEENEPLTWQQQLINPTTLSTAPEKKKGTKKSSSKKNIAYVASATGSPSPAKDSLTWQQELLGSNRPRGPTFDVFADARDEATFGGGSGNESHAAENQSRSSRRKQQPQAGSRKRADSEGESRLRSRAGTKSKSMTAGLPSAPLGDLHSSGSFAGAISSQTPSTPDGKIAYAGPNFHNSPSAASLPVPKFLQQRVVSSGSSGEIANKQPSSPFARDVTIRIAVKEGVGSGVRNDGDISTSSEEENDNDDLKRSTRGATAPPELQQQQGQGSGEDRRSMTIQSLMAKLMMPGSD